MNQWIIVVLNTYTYSAPELKIQIEEFQEKANEAYNKLIETYAKDEREIFRDRFSEYEGDYDKLTFSEMKDYSSSHGYTIDYGYEEYPNGEKKFTIRRHDEEEKSTEEVVIMLNKFKDGVMREDMFTLNDKSSDVDKLLNDLQKTE